MNAPVVYHRGEWIALGKLIAHYRLMARADRRSAAFWRQLTRTVIATYRAQRASVEARGLAA